MRSASLAMSLISLGGALRPSGLGRPALRTVARWAQTFGEAGVDGPEVKKTGDVLRRALSKDGFVSAKVVDCTEAVAEMSKLQLGRVLYWCCDDSRIKGLVFAAMLRRVYLEPYRVYLELCRVVSRIISS